MPVKFEIDIAQRLIVTEVTGKVTVAELLAYRNALHDHPEFSKDLDTLADISGADSFEGAGADIQQFLNGLHASPGTKRAYVAPQLLNFGLSRIAQAYGESRGYEIGVFKTRKEALAWLGRT